MTPAGAQAQARLLSADTLAELWGELQADGGCASSVGPKARLCLMGLAQNVHKTAMSPGQIFTGQSQSHLFDGQAGAAAGGALALRQRLGKGRIREHVRG